MTDHGSGRSGAARTSTTLLSGALRSRHALLGLTLGLALLLFSGAGSVGAQGTADASESTLDAAVTTELSERTGKALSGKRGPATTGEPGAQVNVMREGEGWAFGSAVVEAPKKRGHYPSGWLFVARETDGTWDAKLEGASEFPELLREAPESVVAAGERELLTSEARNPEQTRSTAASVARTGLSLPWKKGTRWRFTGGPHGWATGYDRPYAALDFVGPPGGDQNVRAAAGGYAYSMCSSGQGWIRIYHPNGYSTDYYHLIRNIKPQGGRQVSRGEIIGKTGQDVSCGGASYGRHVHFALLRGDTHVKVGGKKIGGWTFRENQAYGGRAEKNGTIRRPSGSTYMKNFG